MARRHVFCLATATLSLALALAAGSAHAQRPPAAMGPVPLATSLTGDAKADYESAKSLFEIGDFNGARVKFDHAFALSNDSRLLWNMAACEKELHHYGRAVALVDRYLRESGSRITPESRASATASLAALRSLSSVLAVTGLPDGARVFVDGELVGRAPSLPVITLDIGSHKLRVEHPDYETFERTLDGIAGGSEISVAATPKLRTAGRLSVVAGPGDTIALDGKILGADRWSGEVQGGRHALRVSANGKSPYESEIQVPPRGVRTLDVTLRPESKRTVWPWIVGGIAVVGGGVVGGYFLLKPRDRSDSGSPPQGGLGTVVLPAGGRFR